MSRYWLFILLLCSPLVTRGQIDVVVASSCESNPRTLYFSLENHLSVRGFKAGDRLEGRNGKAVQYRNDSLFIYTPHFSKRGIEFYDTISLLRNNVIIARFPMNVIRFCDFQPQLRNAVEGFVSVEGLLSYPTLKFITPGCCVNERYLGLKAGEFELIIDAKGRETPIILNSQQLGFSSEQLKWIKTLKPGDKLTFANIRAWGAQVCNRSFDTFSVTIR